MIGEGGLFGQGAPDATEGIRRARETMEQHATPLAAVGDPIAPSIAALAVAVSAQDRLAVDAFLRIEKLIQDGRSGITAQQVEDIGRLLLGSCQGWLRAFVITSYSPNQAVLAIVVLSAVALGFGAGRWAYSPPSKLACADEADGSRLCWIYSWLPTHH